MDYDLTRRAERAALGAMISDQQLAARLDYLEPRDFTDPRHRCGVQDGPPAQRRAAGRTRELART